MSRSDGPKEPDARRAVTSNRGVRHERKPSPDNTIGRDGPKEPDPKTDRGRSICLLPCKAVPQMSPNLMADCASRVVLETASVTIVKRGVR